MNENGNYPRNDQEGPDGETQQGNELDMGNNLSMGSVSGIGISDFNPEVDSPETEEQEYRDGSANGDDQRSDDNGINPAPSGVDLRKTEVRLDFHIENADEDKLNPYPDELKQDDDDEDEKQFKLDDIPKK
ncbi:hypothetical protein [Daejeonella sp.]|uniref:hypothetical protein n=1 Tax=Daejeonella sp. TaxID=2805397 RepID=UPI00398349E0